MYVLMYGGGGLVAKLCLTLAVPWNIACQAPLSMGFSRQEHWSGLPFPSPRDLPDPGIEPGSPAFQSDSLPSEPPQEQNRKQQVVFGRKYSSSLEEKQKGNSGCISFL